MTCGQVQLTRQGKKVLKTYTILEYEQYIIVYIMFSLSNIVTQTYKKNIRENKQGN